MSDRVGWYAVQMADGGLDFLYWHFDGRDWARHDGSEIVERLLPEGFKKHVKSFRYLGPAGREVLPWELQNGSPKLAALDALEARLTDPPFTAGALPVRRVAMELAIKSTGGDLGAEALVKRAAAIKDFLEGHTPAAEEPDLAGQPLKPVHPGEILREEYLTGPTFDRIREQFEGNAEFYMVLAEQAPLNERIATAMSEVTGQPTQYFLNLQAQFDAAVQQQRVERAPTETELVLQRLIEIAPTATEVFRIRTWIGDSAQPAYVALAASYALDHFKESEAWAGVTIELTAQQLMRAAADWMDRWDAELRAEPPPEPVDPAAPQATPAPTDDDEVMF